MDNKLTAKQIRIKFSKAIGMISLLQILGAAVYLIFFG